MSDAQQLIVTAKSGAEVCAQLMFWTRQLQRALDARRRLLEELPPLELKAALEEQ